MDITLELDIRYHERQKGKGSHQGKKPPVTGSNSSMPSQDSSSIRPHHKKNKKGKQFKASRDKPHSALLNKDSKLIGFEKERRIKEGLCTYCGGKHPIEKYFKRPVLTPTATVPFDCTPSVHQLSANLDRGSPIEGAAPSRRGGMKSRRSRSFSGLLSGYSGMSEGAREIIGEAKDEEREESVEEEDSGETEVADAP
ncbi:hypothetical protein O181_069585 [Austropuccinia psidii MF-1]|uniref:Uncharacterized protein n=1 Tax=Austropuccinia psidii MF-1 TaxID=1389203 RepID=A0A9Q3I882_9BASI|nr:hypothetical protein [Austropuccinia psidii MF-1]